MPRREGIARPCASCGYDLRGLAAGRVCPECGAPPGEPAKLADAISAMPIQVVRMFRAACWLASISALAIIALIVLRPWLPLNDPRHAAALAFASVLWVIAAFKLTPALTLAPAVARGFGGRSRLRVPARWLQLGWIVLAAMNYFDQTLGPGRASAAAGWIGLIGLCGLLSGLAGVFLLGLMLERLAEWARDNVAERSLNLAIFGIPFSIIAVAVSAALSFIPLVAASLALLAVSIAAFPWGLFSLTRSMTWAVHHAREHQEYLERRRRRAMEFDAQRAETIEAADRARERRATS